MPHPIEMVYKNTIKSVVQSFISSLPSHIKYSKLTTDDGQVRQYVDDYTRLWRKSCDEMLTAISRDISYYLNYYGISPRGSIDEFKAVYFTGRVISRFFDREGLSDLRKINDYVTIALLDFRFFLETKRNRAVMTNALRNIAKQNEIEDKLGVHGMYLIYKSMCNAANGK